MKEVKQLFTAKASSFYDTMKGHGGSAGYRIPIYQRMYSWSKENIERLIVDCLNGFYYLSQEKDRDSGSFTFLGTLILVREKDTESSFNGSSLSVVDGQQRLTTLVLIACVLIEEIAIKANEIILEVDNKYANWMKEEKDFQLGCLYECVMGTQSSRAKNFPYPRIIRDGDSRGLSGTDSEYYSIISRFLQNFSEYYENYYKNNEKCVFEFPSIRDKEKEYEQFKKNHETIKDKIQEISVRYDGDVEDREYEILPRKNFEKSGIRDLFERVSVCGDEGLQDKAISTISKDKAFEPLVRLLLFAAYFTRYVVLTSVETDDEKAAFDIFDSLNTTGEPLTALETLKPLVIKFEGKKRRGYKGSDSEISFSKIKSNLDDKVSGDKTRQIETKDAIVSFALYMEGAKLPRDLSRQRTYLRSKYDRISDERKPQFVDAIADITFFRYNYWNAKGIEKLVEFNSTNHRDEIQLCMQLISDMRTSLALPILTRYHSKIHGNGGEKNFFNAVKALTGFLILRRAYTGSTNGIDAVFRSLMEKQPSHKGDPLSVGLDHEHKIWDIFNFKEELRKKLAECMGKVSQENWVEKVVENPLAQQSKPLVKFLLFAAAHHSISDPKEEGLWVRDGVKIAAENEYINYRNWTNSKYGTVEHIAPDSPKNGWDKDIYTQSFRRHTIGNLLLLPEKENKSLGNASWKKKQLFYMAVSEKTVEEATARIAESKHEGIEFSQKTEKLILGGDRLQLLDPIRNVESWTADFIQKRSTNIANLAWDTVSSWLLD